MCYLLIEYLHLVKSILNKFQSLFQYTRHERGVRVPPHRVYETAHPRRYVCLTDGKATKLWGLVMSVAFTHCRLVRRKVALPAARHSVDTGCSDGHSALHDTGTDKESCRTDSFA